MYGVPVLSFPSRTSRLSLLQFHGRCPPRRIISQPTGSRAISRRRSSVCADRFSFVCTSGSLTAQPFSSLPSAATWPIDWNVLRASLQLKDDGVCVRWLCPFAFVFTEWESLSLSDIDWDLIRESLRDMEDGDAEGLFCFLLTAIHGFASDMDVDNDNLQHLMQVLEHVTRPGILPKRRRGPRTPIQVFAVFFPLETPNRSEGSLDPALTVRSPRLTKVTGATTRRLTDNLSLSGFVAFFAKSAPHNDISSVLFFLRLCASLCKYNTGSQEDCFLWHPCVVIRYNAESAVSVFLNF